MQINELITALLALVVAGGGSVTADASPAPGYGTAMPQTYPTGFSVALERGGDLYEALPPKFSDQLAPQPVALQRQDVPQIMPIASKNENKVLRQVSVSAGFIDLVNHLSHAKAIDRIQPGFFDHYVQHLAPATGNDSLSIQWPMMVDPRFWKDDILNDQASYFNQMIGMMVAINLSHHYLGHFDKYAPKMAGPGNKTIPINDLLTPEEWEESVKTGALDAMTCALRADGAMVLFDAIDKMPRRPAWTQAIVPKGANLKELNKELARYQKQFDSGRLNFSLRDKSRFRQAGDESPLLSLIGKTSNPAANWTVIRVWD